MGNKLKDLLDPMALTWGQVGPTPQWGNREDGSPKGRGYLGPVQNRLGSLSTELSAEMDGQQFPLMVPTLTEAELQNILSGQPIPQELYAKALEYAQMRRRAGLSPFFDK